MPETYPELTNCRICPQNCGVDRYVTYGFCQAPTDLKINLHQLHFGEEPVLSGTNGSGTIFFSHCNLRCVFCQNYNISEHGWGSIVSEERLLEMMLELQKRGAHNINLVTPTHYSIQLINILQKARRNGFNIPVVWNSNAYEKVEILEKLEGLVDIYLPDLKFALGEFSDRYSHVADYPARARQAILEMNRQVGLLKTDDNGIAEKGLIIRLLVMPNQVAGVSDTLRWITENLGNETFISLMAQYYPAGQAKNYDKISRGITQQEYDDVLETLESLDFANGFTQELSCSSEWIPEFRNETDGKKQ
jgi:putative pyruvate formate lyase activating enzyme